MFVDQKSRDTYIFITLQSHHLSHELQAKLFRGEQLCLAAYAVVILAMQINILIVLWGEEDYLMTVLK